MHPAVLTANAGTFSCADPSVSDIIGWDETGEVIEVRDQTRFVAEVMMRVVKSRSFCAFVRQVRLKHS